MRTIKSTSWRSFKAARNYARSLGLRGAEQWTLWTKGKLNGYPKKPKDIPSSPASSYASKGWTSWGDFLGTGYVFRPARAWRPYEEASAFAIQLGITSGQQWDDFCAGRIKELGLRPSDVPADPSLAYRGCGWAGWPAFLGKAPVVVGTVRTMLPFIEARAVASSLGLKTVAEYRAWCSGRIPSLPARSKDMPTNPQTTYFDKGWISWTDFLGNAPRKPTSLISATLDILLG